MITRFEASFEKDLKKIKSKKVLSQIKTLIINAREAQTLSDINNLKKLKGYDTFYRIRLGAYRIGFEVIDDTVIFVRCLTRKDIYRYFPKK